MGLGIRSEDSETTIVIKPPNKWWVVVIGAGLALSPIHNKWLTNLATNDAGETLFFLPAVGYLLLIMGATLFLLHNWERVKEVGWGDKKIVVPLLFIIAAIGLSGVGIDGGVTAKLAPLGMGLFLFAVYLTARVLGKAMFLPLAVGAGVASLGIIAHQICEPGMTTGGFIFERNFDIATGYILLGVALLVRNKRQWLLAGLALLSLLMSGAPEAVFALGVIGFVVLLRRDWGVKSAVLIPTVIAVIFVFASGYGQTLFHYTYQSLAGHATVRPIPEMGTTEGMSPLLWRWHVIKVAMGDISSLGDGYNLTNFTVSTVHNVPLIIIQQLGWLGLLAGLAWLWISVWCLVKTRWKYAWALVLTLSVFDHFIWTQLAPVWPALIGASTTDVNNKSDLVFRGEKL